MLAWFDYWLKGADNGIMNQPAVRYFVPGPNIWREAGQWPPAESVVQPYYLHSFGHANSLNGDGVLRTDPPGAQPADGFIYDPSLPFPSDWKDELGHIAMADQRTVEERGDVLVYTTDELKQGVELAGCVHARLFASSSAPDTDFTCRLLDVFPDGSARVLLSGLVRAKFRKGSPALLIEPGKAYEYDIELGNIANLFAEGHRIRVEISSSLYPKYDRNLNTGEPLGKGSTYNTASQTVIHNEAMPSALLLPVMIGHTIDRVN
jgi:putative CocE/NonD family hydrolase